MLAIVLGPMADYGSLLIFSQGATSPCVSARKTLSGNSVGHKQGPLIAEDTIRPYENMGSGRRLNEMRLFELSWPRTVLYGLADSEVTLRVASSTFIEPNPSEVARGRKNRYGWHGLRFALKGADETIEQFTRRVGRTGEDHEQDDNGPYGGEWKFGNNLRSVRLLYIDTLTTPASDLAQSGVSTAYPVGGWWKENRKFDLGEFENRFSLVVEIDADEQNVDLFAEIQQAIAVGVAIQI